MWRFRMYGRNSGTNGTGKFTTIQPELLCISDCVSVHPHNKWGITAHGLCPVENGAVYFVLRTKGPCAEYKMVKKKMTAKK